jgi:lipopolysaccharide transport system permease protein
MKASVDAVRDPSLERSPRRATARTAHVLADLLYVMTARDIKIKYKQSVMGLMWAILMPAIIVGAGMLIRVAMAKMSGTPVSPDSLASITVKALPWAFFIGALRFATNSLTSNANLVTKINCPRIAFPASAVLSALFDLAVAVLPLVAILAWAGVPFGAALLWVPLLIALLALLVSGLGFAFSAANLFFRDVKYIVEVILTFAIFFTPVFYEADMLGEWRFWILLNPVAPILEGLRSAVVLNQAPDPGWLLYSGGFSLLVFLGGWKLSTRSSPRSRTGCSRERRRHPLRARVQALRAGRALRLAARPGAGDRAALLGRGAAKRARAISGPSRTSISRCAKAKPSASSATTAPARAPCSSTSPASWCPPRAASRSTVGSRR